MPQELLRLKLYIAMLLTFEKLIQYLINQPRREDRGPCREEVGEIVGLSKGHVGAIERDSRRLTPDRARAFERALSLGDGELNAGKAGAL